MAAQRAQRRQREFAGTRLRQIALALLFDRPTYAYSLYSRMEERFGDVLPSLNTSAVYQTVDALHGQGLIEQVPRTARAGERMPKVSYRLTRQGVATLSDWLAEEIAEDTVSAEIDTRLLATTTASGNLEVLASVIARAESACLVAADRLEAGNAARDSDPARGLAAALLAEKRRVDLNARMEWVHYAKAHVAAARAESEPAEER